MFVVSSSLRVLNGLPHAVRCGGHVEVFHAQRFERVQHGVDDGRRRADGTRFAAALAADGVVRAGRADMAELEFGEICRARHGVVHVAAGEQLAALGVVHPVLHQRLADALHQFKIENNEVTDVTTILKSWSDQVDYHCSVSIAADTMLYVVTGNVCLKSSPNMTTDLKLHFENDKKLTIKNKLDGSLTLKTNNPAMSYQLINALGKISLSKNLNFPATDIDIPVQNIPKGVYILSVVFENNKTAVKKWIKH